MLDIRVERVRRLECCKTIKGPDPLAVSELVEENPAMLKPSDSCERCGHVGIRWGRPYTAFGLRG